MVSAFLFQMLVNISYICAMIAAILIMIFVGTIALDWLAYHRFIRYWHSKSLRYATILFLVLTNSLPLLVVSLSDGLFLFDNTQQFANMAMAASTLYIFAILPRIALYVGLLTIKHLTTARAVGIILSVSVLCILFLGICKTRTDLIIKSIRLKYNNLPASFDGYRIAFISDLHIGAMLNTSEFCTKIVDTLNSQYPDMVVFGGDLVNIRHTELTSRIERILSRIKAADGVVAVLGNHDMGIYIKDTVALPRHVNVERLCESVRKMGWRMLRDSTIYVHRGVNSISVTGIDFSERLLELRYKFSFDDGDYDLRPIYADVPDSLFNITVSHLPQLWHEITKTGYGDLTLAGHVHAAQIKVDLNGLRLSPAMLMYREWSGVYDDNGRKLYINDGVGTVGFYMRIGAKPEITLIELCN